MIVLNLSKASAYLGFRSCVALRRLHRKGQLKDYLRNGPDKRALYLETEPYGLPSLQRHVQNHTRFNADSPIWHQESALSEEALDEAMAPINEWIESREVDSWEARAAAFIDPSCWSAPPWSPQEWRNLKAIIELAEDS